MAKLPSNFLYFDIESGGLEGAYSSILSISYQKENQQGSFYAKPTRGSWLSQWSKKNVWEQVKQRTPGTEEEALKGFLNVLEAHKGGTVAGWNIGVEPIGQLPSWKGEDFRGPRGFDIPMLITRAEKYGLGEQYKKAFSNVTIKDIGREYSYKIAKAIYPYRDLVDEQLWRSTEQIVKLGNAFEAQGLTEEQAAKELAKSRYQLAGWKQENVYQLLFDKKYQAHESATDIAALQEIVEKGDLSKLGTPEFAKQWNKLTLKQSIINKVFKGARPFEQAADLYPSLIKRAEIAGIKSEVESAILSEAKSRGANLLNLQKGLGYTEVFQKIGGISAEGGVAQSFFKSATFIADIAKRNPIKTALGVGLGFAFLTKPLNWFSGGNDQYNTIQGFNHQGISGQTRKQNTDFGSGYQGLKDTALNLVNKFNRLSSIKKGLIVGGVVTGGLLTTSIFSRDPKINNNSFYDPNYRPQYKDINLPGLAITKEDTRYERSVKRRFGEFADLLQNFGQETGTGHKRIVIPKEKLTQEDIEQVLGFVPVTIAIPEAGQTDIGSYRHPYALFHLHEHDQNWTMHEDEHVASTMLNKQWAMRNDPNKSLLEPVINFFTGLPHVVTEGIPGLGYYLAGQVTGAADMVERLQQEIPKQYFDIVNRMHSIERPTELGRKYVELMQRVKLKANQAINWISGKDDNYNTIEGLRHGGIAEGIRRRMTNFGSGYQGSKEDIVLWRGTPSFISVHSPQRENKADLLKVETLYEQIRRKHYSHFPQRSKVTYWSTDRFYAAGFMERYQDENRLGESGGFLSIIKKKRSEINVFSDEIYGYVSSALERKNIKEAVKLTHYYWQGKDYKGNPLPKNDYAGEVLLTGDIIPDKIYELNRVTDKLTPRMIKGKHWISQVKKKINDFSEWYSGEDLSDYTKEGEKIVSKIDTKVAGKIFFKKKLAFGIGLGLTGIVGFFSFFSGKDDKYNTIEGLRHGGIAEKQRKELTDFGSGWIRKALSKGISAERVASVSARLGKQLEVKLTKEGKEWVVGKGLGKGGFGVVSEAFEAGTGRAGIYKHIGEAKQIKEGEGILSPAFSRKMRPDNTREMSEMEMFVKEYFVPSGDLLRKTINEYGGMGAAHEAAMQRMARQRLGSTVPEVYGTTETGLFMESAGAPIKAGEEVDALKWLQNKWVEELSHIPSPGETMIHHLDPQIKNIMKKGKQYKLIDWGVAIKTQESLPRSMVNAAEDAYNEYVERAMNKVRAPQVDKSAMARYHRKAVATMTKTADAPGRGHTKPVGTMPVGTRPVGTKII